MATTVVLVPSVYPPGSNVSITGQVVTGDGHLVGGVEGHQLGTVSIRLSKAVSSVGSAQAFGVPTIKSAISRSVVGLASAQSFGVPTTKIGKVVGGVSSAQAFGAVTIKMAFAVGGVTGAQVFGAVTIKTTVSRAVGGIGTAQVIGTVTVTSVYRFTPTGVSTAQSFGTITIRVGGQSRTPAPVLSAAAFGTLKFKVTVPPVGSVPSAQAFGVVVIKATITVPVQGIIPYPTLVPSITGAVITGDGHIVGGYGGPGWMLGRPTIYTFIRTNVGSVFSAANFGAPWIVQTVHPNGIPSAQQFGTKIGFKFRVLGIGSAQAFGHPRVYLVWLRPPPDYDFDLADLVCSDLDLAELACLTGSYTSPLVASELDLVPAASIDIDLQPAGCQ